MASELDIVVVVPELTTSVTYPGITSNVNIPGVQPNSKSSLTTSVTIEGLNTSVTTPGLTSAIQQEVPLTATVTGVVDSVSTPGLFTRALDSVSISAPTYISVLKPFTETIQIADSVLVVLRFDRNVLETLAVNSDAISFQANTTFEENTSALDVTYKEFLKAVTTQTNYILDVSSIQVTKVFEDGVVNSSFNTIIIGKNTVDSITITDIDNITITADYIRTFEDLVDATDDYYGAASIGEDEYAAFNKVVVDSIQNSETISSYIASIREDIAQITEQKYSEFSKLLTDFSGGLVEDINYRVGKATTELINTTETSVLNISLTKSEISSTSELFTRLANYLRDYVDLAASTDTSAKLLSIQKQDSILGITDIFSTFIYWMREFTTDFISSSDFARYIVRKALTETNSTLDQSIFNFAKVINDANSISELINYQLNYARSFEDLVDATDDYYGAATIGDDEYASFTKVIADGILQTDTAIFNIAKILANIGTSTDSLANTVGKYLSDQTANLEFIPKTTVALKLETTNTSEAKYFDISSTLADTATSTELFVRSAEYLRSFVEASQLQDLTAVYAQLVKTDNVNNSEIFTSLIEAYRQLSDSSQLSEYTIKTIGKILIDTPSITESRSVDITKLLADIYSISDLLTSNISYTRNFEDFVDITDDYYGAATIGDDEYASFNKTILNNVLNVDTTKFDIVKILQDISYNTDTSKYTFTKPVTESTYSAEVSQKLASILKLDTTGLYNSDSTRVTTQPNKFDNILSADVLTYFKSTGNLFTDIIYSTDSGVIYNQNYFADSYVTPGYAGTITYFGT